MSILPHALCSGMHQLLFCVIDRDRSRPIDKKSHASCTIYIVSAQSIDHSQSMLRRASRVSYPLLLPSLHIRTWCACVFVESQVYQFPSISQVHRFDSRRWGYRVGPPPCRSQRIYWSPRRVGVRSSIYREFRNPLRTYTGCTQSVVDNERERCDLRSIRNARDAHGRPRTVDDGGTHASPAPPSL